MFLMGLKFALGFVAGLSLLSGMAMLGLIGAELYNRWRVQRRRPQWEAKARVLRHAVVPQFRECAVFHFRFRSEDWPPMRDKIRDLQ